MKQARTHVPTVEVLGYDTVPGISHPVPRYATTCSECDRKVRRMTGLGGPTKTVFWHAGGGRKPGKRGGTEKERLGVALTRMVDPLTTIRLAARNAEESLADGEDPSSEIAAIREAAQKLNAQLVELRTSYPHPKEPLR